MAIHNRQTFTAVVNGVTYRFEGTTNRNTETISCLSHNITRSKYTWYNRPWQSFHYETALYTAIRKFPKDVQDEFERQLITERGKAAHEKAEADIARFKGIHDKCSDRQKAMLANANIHMESEEDVKRVEALMLLGQLLGI